ncbi:MAG: MTH1187 family thiamine-binding protein [Deltaproteobacteria bacterium]|nr:MTH1187 family thiamine-binding protein [Deltaproteobacteria bacterium]
MNLLIDFSMFPLDKGESVSPYVARLLRVIRESGLPHKLGPMGTTIEGEWHQVMAVVTHCFEELSKDCDRVYFAIKGDYRKKGKNRITAKVESVEKQL